MNGRRTQGAGLREMLERLNAALAIRDPSIAQSFAADAVLAGSDQSDFARGREAIAGHFAEIMAKPYTIAFDWAEVDERIVNECGWLFAEGQAVIIRDGGDGDRLPYRLSATFRRDGERWLWTLFHGSEPRP